MKSHLTGFVTVSTRGAWTQDPALRLCLDVGICYGLDCVPQEYIQVSGTRECDLIWK